ncbi:MAG: FAD:protein FMN transferase, partial [Lautropia sp.]|nr:FAD:protein FMN transferase [Lautropia sp.]
LHQQSDGAFDITLLPALDAWGFGPKAAAQKASTVIQPGTRLDDSILSGKQPAAAPGNSPSTLPPGTPPSSGTPTHAAPAPRPPAAPVTTAGQPGNTGLHAPGEAELASLRHQIGLEHLRIDGDRLCKDAPISIEFNSIAAGAVIDQIADRFQALGIDSYLIEVTGELRAQGAKPDGSPWRIGIETPIDGSTRQAQKILSLNGQAVSTSGDYRQYREENGQRLSHILDPRSLRPITHRLAAVTVLHPLAMQADGLSTLLMVLGPDDGYTWAVEHQIPALFVSRSDHGFESRSTPAFDRLHPPTRPAETNE